MPCFTNQQALLLGAFGLIAPIDAGHAGPCKAQIDGVQAEVDARVAAIASAGPVKREATATPVRPEPTPGPVSRVQETLGERTSVGKALSALARAQEADRRGNERNCEHALEEARRSILP
jgi:hypothetical protein